MKFGLMRIISQVESWTLNSRGLRKRGLFCDKRSERFLLISGALDFNHGLAEEPECRQHHIASEKSEMKLVGEPRVGGALRATLIPCSE